MSTDDKFGLAAICGLGVFLFGFIAAWGTHIITCISDEKWLFLIAGAIAFPVAIVHGIGVWFGFWV